MTPRRVPALVILAFVTGVGIVLLSQSGWEGPLRAQSRWGPEMRLTTFGWETTANGMLTVWPTIHYVWANGQIWHKRSMDGGTTWGADAQITSTRGQSTMPAIAQSGSTLVLTWMDDTPGTMALYFKRSTDGGQTWGPDTRIPETADVGRHWLATSGSTILLVWHAGTPFGTAPNIFLKRSTDGGNTWEPATAIGGGGARPTVDTFGSTVHVSWSDNRDGGQHAPEIYYRRSRDGGATWDPERRITRNTWWSGRQRLAVSHETGVIYMVWDDGYVRTGDRYDDTLQELYFTKSADGGQTWDAPKPITSAPGSQTHPYLVAAGSDLHVVWTDSRAGSRLWRPYYKSSPDGGVTWGPDEQLSPADGRWAGFLSVHGSDVLVTYGAEPRSYYRKRIGGGTLGR